MRVRKNVIRVFEEPEKTSMGTLFLGYISLLFLLCISILVSYILYRETRSAEGAIITGIVSSLIIIAIFRGLMKGSFSDESLENNDTIKEGYIHDVSKNIYMDVNIKQSQNYIKYDELSQKLVKQLFHPIILSISISIPLTLILIYSISIEGKSIVLLSSLTAILIFTLYLVYTLLKKYLSVRKCISNGAVCILPSNVKRYYIHNNCLFFY